MRSNPRSPKIFTDPSVFQISLQQRGDLIRSDLVAHLVRLEARGHPGVLLQGAPGVVIRVGVALVDVTPGGCLASNTRHQGLQLDLARHPASHVGFGFSEMKVEFISYRRKYF